MAPEGTEEARHPRLTSPVGNALQVTAALLFASYFFFPPALCLLFAAVSPLGLNLLGWRACQGTAAAYLLQLIFYKPHLRRGWWRPLLYSSLGDYAARYYDSTCVREGPRLDPSGQYMFAMYPHGVYGVCRVFTSGLRLWCKLFPGITLRWGSFGAAFIVPGVREFSLCAGCLDAGRETLSRAAKRGENIALLPGGIDEMSLTDGTSTDTKLVMVDRKGYARLAIEHGMDIVPGFCFGEKWIHRTVQLPPMIRNFLRRFRMSGTLLKGRGPSFLGFLGVPLGFVWGEPIRVKKPYPVAPGSAQSAYVEEKAKQAKRGGEARQSAPVDPAYVDEVHAQVEAAVRDIFDRYKERFGYGPEETLTMVAATKKKKSQ